MNLVDVFGDRADFYVLTQNHDFKSSTAYSEFKSDEWNDLRSAKVFYSSLNSFSFRFLLEITRGFDVVYLCEPYRAHSWRTLILKKFGLIQSQLYLAPMGCFSPAALKQKQFKKKLFWFVFNVLNFGRDVTWSLTLEKERSRLSGNIGASPNSLRINAVD